MYESALDTIYNILDFISAFGYMPNGSRIYFVGRT